MKIFSRQGGEQYGSDSPMTRERVLTNLDYYQKVCAHYRLYPDRLVDLLVKLSGPECRFKLHPFQIILLRIMARFPTVFFTFSRGTSKTFLNTMHNILMCMMYPGIKLAMASGSKEQSAELTLTNIREILAKIPALRREVVGGDAKKDKTNISLTFKNGSSYTNVGALSSARGLRRHGITFEEIVLMKKEILEEVLEPLTTVVRIKANGEPAINDYIQAQQVSVTTAGMVGHHSHERLVDTLIQQVVNPGSAFILGGSWHIPVLAKLQTISYFRKQRSRGELDIQGFDREYNSIWSAGIDGAFFNPEVFDKNRTLKMPIFNLADAKLKANEGLYAGIDVGRVDDKTEITVWKRIPLGGGNSSKHLLYMETIDSDVYEAQAIRIKQLDQLFNFKAIAIDRTGVGLPLADELITKNHIDSGGNFLPALGVINDDKDIYRGKMPVETIKGKIFCVVASAPLNTEAYTIFQSQLYSGRLKFLIGEQQAKLSMEASRAQKFQSMSSAEKANYLMPFFNTSYLRNQLGNLVDKRDGVNIFLERAVSQMKKDKASSSFYAVYYMKKFVDDKEINNNNNGIVSWLTGANSKSGKSNPYASRFEGIRKAYGNKK